MAIQSPAQRWHPERNRELTVDTTPDVGFDIDSTVRNGTTVNVQGLAALRVGGQARFYKITLFADQATFRGVFAAQHQAIGIAIALNQL